MRAVSILASSAILMAACGSPVDASGSNRFSQQADAPKQAVNDTDRSLADPTHEEACQLAWSALPSAQRARRPDRAAFLAECRRAGRWVMSCADGWIEFGPEPAGCIGHGGSRDTFWQPDG